MRRWLELLLFSTPALLAFVAAPLLARALGPIGRGEFAIALVAFAFGQNLGNVGQAEIFSADLREQNSRIRILPRMLVTLSASVVAAAGAYIVLTSLGAGCCTALIVAIVIPAASSGLLLRAFAISRGRTLLLSVELAVPAVVRLVVIIALFVAGSLTVCAATTVTMLSTVGGFLLIAVILARGHLLRWFPSVRRNVDTPHLLADFKDSFRRGLPAFGFKLNFLVMMRADVLLLGLMSTPEQVGYYAAVTAVTDTALAVSTTFKNRMQAAAYSPTSFRKIRREFVALIGVLLPIVAFGELFAEKFVVALFGAAFAPAVPAFRILIVASVALIVLDCGQGLLAVFGQQRIMFVTSLVGSGVAILSLLILVPTLGALGAAVSSLCAYVCLATASWIAALRVMPRR